VSFFRVRRDELIHYSDFRADELVLGHLTDERERFSIYRLPGDFRQS
jgi:hypothetical protein